MIHSAVALGRSAVPRLTRSWAVAILFGMAGLALIAGPSVVDGQIPGDLGDARFNSYVLEHFFRWISRQDASFWSAGFFYPFPLTIAFSDNFLGNAFVYAFFRAVGLAREDAFRLWYVAGFVVNFAAADYALVRFRYSRFAAALGAFLFTFGLPIMTQEGHAQLLYRFGVPLAVLALEGFRSRRQLRQLSLAAFWTTWQFYCSIYTGYFLTLLLLSLSLSHVLVHRGGPITGFRSSALALYQLWTDRSARAKLAFLLAMTVIAAMMAALCAPYLAVSRLYNFRRQWFEIASMLPRPVSYLLANDSLLWSSTGSLFDALPMRHEHAMFIGGVPFLAVAIAVTLWLANRVSWDPLFAPVALATLLIVILTLWVDGHSAYRTLASLPGVNAIRGVTRIITVLLFPSGVLLASSLDAIAAARLLGWARLSMVALIGALLLVETSNITHYKSTKDDWQTRMAAVAAESPPTIPKAPILLLAPRPDEPEHWRRELDAMLFAQDRGWRTLNGYSGNTPPGHELTGGCEDAARLLATSLTFLGRDTEQNYDDLVRHVVMVGYPPCEDMTLLRHPRLTMFAGQLPAELMANVALRIKRLDVQDDQVLIAASIANDSSITLPAYSTTAMPIRLSARFIDPHATPTDLNYGAGWDSRQAIGFDVPPGASLPVVIRIAPPAKPGTYRVAVSMVQDAVAWFHDHGLHVPISMQTIEVDQDHTVHVSDATR
jgi:hypothetical protein